MSQIDDVVKAQARAKFESELDSWVDQNVLLLGIKDEKLRNLVQRRLDSLSKLVHKSRIDEVETEAIEDFVNKHLGISKAVKGIEYRAGKVMPVPFS
jgi:hypothetical protein